MGEEEEEELAQTGQADGERRRACPKRRRRWPLRGRSADLDAITDVVMQRFDVGEEFAAPWSFGPLAVVGCTNQSWPWTFQTPRIIITNQTTKQAATPTSSTTIHNSHPPFKKKKKERKKAPSMPPLPPHLNPLPRLITYHQTHHHPSGAPISLLPLLTEPSISITHVILAAIHLNSPPEDLTLNDHHPSHPRFQTLWAELRVLQASGIKVLGMLGGAAKGTYARLDASLQEFESFYAPLRRLVLERGLDGLDLDVEEPMSLAGIIRLIDRLRTDFGKGFLITMAPVAMAMLDPAKNLSGFDYEALEVMRGREIAWYNTQFYCGWGNLSNTLMYDLMLQKGWCPDKIVIGVVTNPANGHGFVHWDMLSAVLGILSRRHQNFGGVMGWEYFNSLPGDASRPWEWATNLTSLLREHSLVPASTGIPEQAQSAEVTELDPDPVNNCPLQVPQEFEYHSDRNPDS